jgi:hypothetical protein
VDYNGAGQDFMNAVVNFKVPQHGISCIAE